MRITLIILTIGLFAAGCGEQFQGDFTGEAFVLDDTCTSEDKTKVYTMTVRSRVSGGDLSFRIVDFEDQTLTDGRSSLLGNRKRSNLLLGIPLTASLVSDNQIETRDEDARKILDYDEQILFNLGLDSLPASEQQKLEEDFIYVSGELNESRDEMTNFKVLRFAEVPINGAERLKDCRIEIGSDRLVLDQ